MKSINVLVVTYNHEKYIGRFLDSVLEQKEYGLNKIILCDDQSKDNNVQVITEYVRKYPEIVELHINEKNLGIYGNFNHLLDVKGTADFYYIAAGDDAICPGLFKVVQETIDANIIDCTQPISISCDWKSVNSNTGYERRYSNRKVIKGESPYRLKIRNQIYGRSTLISKSVLDQYRKVPVDKGITYAELLFDCQKYKYLKQSYHIPFVGSIYYTQIGESTKMSNEKTYRDNIYAWENFPIAENLNRKDTYFCKTREYKYKFLLKPSLKSLIAVIYYDILSFDWKIGFDWKTEVILYRSIFNRLFSK